MSKGRYGDFGGQYVPETLMNAVNELEEAYNTIPSVYNLTNIDEFVEKVK